MEEINFKEVFNYFKTKKIFIIFIVMLILILGNVYSYMKKPMYSSNSKLILVSDKNGNYNSNDIQLNKDLVGTYSEILKSRKVLNQVMFNLHMRTSYKKLYDHVIVSGAGEKEIISIRVNDESAINAQMIATEIVRVFISEVNEIYDLDNVTVIDEPTFEINPYNKNYIKDNIIYILLSIVVSFGIVFVMFYFDTTIKSSDVVEDKFGLTVLGLVPKESKGD